MLFTLFGKAPTYHCFLLCGAGQTVVTYYWSENLRLKASFAFSGLYCRHLIRLSSRAVLSYTLIFIYFLFNKWANVSFKSVFKRLNPATINAFTETQKFISTSKGFSSHLEKNFRALILLFPLSRIWDISQNMGKLSYNFKYLSVAMPHSEFQMYFLTLLIQCTSLCWPRS